LDKTQLKAITELKERRLSQKRNKKRMMLKIFIGRSKEGKITSHCQANQWKKFSSSFNTEKTMKRTQYLIIHSTVSPMSMKLFSYALLFNDSINESINKPANKPANNFLLG